MGAESSSIALHLQGVSKHFEDGDDQPVVKDVSLTVKQGELVCIVGPSGCGKTTLLRMIAGLLSKSSGDIDVRRGEGYNTRPRAVLLFQEYNRSLLPWRTALGNVEFGLGRSEAKREARREIARSYLRLVQLQDYADRYPWQLSGGMQQRVALARALAFKPTILLMDEPFGSLDAFTRSALEDELLDLWQRLGLTIVLVTHDIDEAIYLAQRIVVLSARPATIRTILEVSLPAPRTQLATRQLGEYLSLRQDVFALLKRSAHG